MEFLVYNKDFITCFGKKIVCGLREGTDDFDCVQAVAVEDEYNLKAIPFEDGDIVIDVGAHIGSVSLALATLDKKLKIYSYEPLPENIDLLKKNAFMNGCGNIFPFLLAVSNKIGKSKVYYMAESTEGGIKHHFIGNAYDFPKGAFYEVDTVTLEKIFLDNKIEKCKLVKLDPEGEELNILEACPPEILKKIDYIVGEHHFVKRDVILKATKGLFEDIACPWQTETELGHFWFKRKNL